MYALAEFIMRGRLQASIIALLGSIVPFASPATIGLVMLRKGSLEAGLVALWASLPLLISYFYGQSSPFLVAVSVIALIHIITLAFVLGVSASWAMTLVASSGLSVVLALIAGALFAVDFAELVSDIGNMFVLASEQAEQALNPPKPYDVLAGIAWVLGITSLVGLSIARWWQSLLVNPGGFQSEFHSIRLDLKVAMVCIVLVVLGFTLLTGVRLWLLLAIVPLLVAGLSLVHYAISAKRLGKQWLVLIYVGLLLGPFTPGLLAALGAADTVLNLRSRLVKRS
ncbi:MAG: hypothetical protein P8Q37_07030 [Porticoccaceae bacterium]|nr:hypothetical protein [Porticoccaceae bacterium]MDG1474641.1 hypothetical protein [Porticoccaceae bacterium]